jgi:hypothetical protein
MPARKPPQIVGGRIGYKRTVQPREYESKTAEVEFSFTVDDGEDPAELADEALAMARDSVNAVLGVKRSRDD